MIRHQRDEKILTALFLFIADSVLGPFVHVDGPVKLEDRISKLPKFFALLSRIKALQQCIGFSIRIFHTNKLTEHWPKPF